MSRGTGPIIETPLSKIGQHMFTQQSGPCAGYEMDVYTCGSRVGRFQAEIDCKKQIEDLKECLFHGKQIKRYLAMYEERKKQKRPHIEPPPADCVYLNHNR